MNPGFHGRLRTCAVAIIMAAASGQIGAADRHPDKAGSPGAVLPVSFTAGVAPDAARLRATRERSRSARSEVHLAPQSLPAGLSPFPYDAFAPEGEAPGEPEAFDRPYARLYPIGSGGGWGESGAAGSLRSSSGSPAQAVAQNDRIPSARSTFFPEPGNWSMILAGLLGVCAIARRRMSV